MFLRGWSNLKYISAIAYKLVQGEVFESFYFSSWSRDFPRPVVYINLNPDLQ